VSKVIRNIPQRKDIYMSKKKGKEEDHVKVGGTRLKRVYL
jgi:hypothetical protein